MKLKEIEKLQTKLFNKLATKNLSFDELLNLLNKTELPEARATILDVMEIYHGNDFMKWIMGM